MSTSNHRTSSKKMMVHRMAPKSARSLLFLLLAETVSGGWYGNFSDNRPFEVRTTRFICSDNESNHHVVIHECSLKLLRNGSSLLTFNASFLEPVQPLWISVKSLYKTNAHIFHPLLGIDERLEICQFVANRTGGNTFSETVLKLAQKFSPQLVKPCPINGEFSVKDFIFDESMFPPFLPAGDMRTDARYYNENNETLFAVKFYGTVRAKGAADLSMG